MKQKRLLPLFLVILSLTVVIRVQPTFIAKANPNNQLIPVLSMPKEYINYTITSNKGQFWAKVYGKYPITILNPSCSLIQLPMVYPTPPNTTNIHITLNNKEASWTNYSQIHPKALHHTAIGNWSMIQCILENVSNSFLLEIQYEHQVQQINGEYVFLYDLNISPYLSTQSPTSTAYFTLNFESDIENLQIFMTKTDTQWNPVNYTTQKSNSTTIISTQIDSNYSESLLDDLAITFNIPYSQEPQPFLLITSIVLTSIFAIGILSYFNKQKRKNHK